MRIHDKADGNDPAATEYLRQRLLAQADLAPERFLHYYY